MCNRCLIITKPENCPYKENEGKCGLSKILGVNPEVNCNNNNIFPEKCYLIKSSDVKKRLFKPFCEDCDLYCKWKKFEDFTMTLFFTGVLFCIGIGVFVAVMFLS